MKYIKHIYDYYCYPLPGSPLKGYYEKNNNKFVIIADSEFDIEKFIKDNNITYIIDATGGRSDYINDKFNINVNVNINVNESEA